MIAGARSFGVSVSKTAAPTECWRAQQFLLSTERGLLSRKLSLNVRIRILREPKEFIDTTCIEKSLPVDGNNVMIWGFFDGIAWMRVEKVERPENN
ncbi:hypothetical protein TNCV_273281 [Trichonephila clavipes]|nr:hypothetical protein TNCV_273281 [Trichonephila clavipes]